MVSQSFNGWVNRSLNDFEFPRTLFDFVLISPARPTIPSKLY